MTNSPYQLQVFIGSSAEGLLIARTLQAELEANTDCLVHRWDIGTFDPGSLTLDALIQQANVVDFAILVATGEDTIITRGAEVQAVRDNIIFEFGLFVGALGRERVYLLSVGEPKLPSDLLGLTRLVYRPRSDGDVRSGLNDAVLRAQNVIRKLGPRKRPVQSDQQPQGNSTVERIAGEALILHSGTKEMPNLTHGSMATVHKEQTLQALEEEIDWLCSNAIEQGWSVIKRNPTLLRLRSPKSKDFTLSRTRPASTRAELRTFVTELRANGLRVNRALQGKVEESPFG